MRHRGAGGNGEANDPGGSASVLGMAQLKRFDVYMKVHDDYRVETKSGGLISLSAFVIMVILFISELRTYLTVEAVDHIMVDTTLNQKLPIGLNVTFPHLRCDEVSVDTVDSAGDNQVDVGGDLMKVNLDAQGQLSQGDPVVSPEDCLSCMEAAGLVETRCCNTCGELKAAYAEAGMPYHHILAEAPQCRNSVGCQIHGDVLVSKVSGNVHVALGKSTVRDGKHVHEFNIKEVSDGFNTSHAIHRLEFGERVRGVSSPLEGTTKIVKHGAYMFHYYIKLVPTLFKASGRVVYTHQYSVTDSEKNVMVRKGELSGLPGVFLVYEFTPFMVEKTEKVVPLSHFLISVCAIIGGVFTVSGMIDAALYRSSRSLGKIGSKDAA
mmetsp:Transcript_36088/g.93032  ORF Transcript_36088/g.93032 Transcript_36088/m.93032 type:complete len:379 (+) Transcript_36088:92-1228(+)